jgi:hypothetical protein
MGFFKLNLTRRGKVPWNVWHRRGLELGRRTVRKKCNVTFPVVAKENGVPMQISESQNHADETATDTRGYCLQS